MKEGNKKASDQKEEKQKEKTAREFAGGNGPAPTAGLNAPHVTRAAREVCACVIERVAAAGLISGPRFWLMTPSEPTCPVTGVSVLRCHSVGRWTPPPPPPPGSFLNPGLTDGELIGFGEREVSREASVSLSRKRSFGVYCSKK